MFNLKFDKRGVTLFFIILSYSILSQIASVFVDSLTYEVISLIFNILMTFAAVSIFASFFDKGKGFNNKEIKNISKEGNTII